jgi:hypothetical protein
MSTEVTAAQKVAIDKLVKQVVSDWMKSPMRVYLAYPNCYAFDLEPVNDAIYNAWRNHEFTRHPTKYIFDEKVLHEYKNVLGTTAECLCDALLVELPLKFPEMTFVTAYFTNVEYHSGLGTSIAVEWKHKLNDVEAAIQGLVKQVVDDHMSSMFKPTLTDDKGELVFDFNQANMTIYNACLVSAPSAKYTFHARVPVSDIGLVLDRFVKQLCDAFDATLPTKFPDFTFGKPRVLGGVHYSGLGNLVSVNWTLKPSDTVHAT